MLLQIYCSKEYNNTKVSKGRKREAVKTLMGSGDINILLVESNIGMLAVYATVEI